MVSNRRKTVRSTQLKSELNSLNERQFPGKLLEAEFGGTNEETAPQESKRVIGQHSAIDVWAKQRVTRSSTSLSNQDVVWWFK